MRHVEIKRMQHVNAAVYIYIYICVCVCVCNMSTIDVAVHDDADAKVTN